MIVEIWGTYPPPIGGITIHIYRLVHYLRKLRDVRVRDFKGTGTHDQPYIFKVKNPAIEFLLLPFKRRRIIHIHTSQIGAFLLLIIFGRKHDYVLTLHGWSLYNNKRKWQVLILSMFLKMVHFIFMNDKNLAESYKNRFGLPPEKIIVVPAYLKPLNEEKRSLPDEIIAFRNKTQILISANAYKLYKSEEGDVYGFDLLISLVKELKAKAYPVGLIFCAPQKGDEVYQQECEQQIHDLGLEEDIFIYNKPIPNGFQVWELSDLFIRPTLTDMEGLSVKEALAFGTPVVASDVCVRPNEAILFKKGNFDDLLDKTIFCLDNNPEAGLTVSEGDDTIWIVNSIYKKIEENNSHK